MSENKLVKPITTVILKNGAEEVEPLVAVTMMSLRRLMKEDPIAFYEVVMVARDYRHKPFGNTGDVLRSLAFLNGNQMHESTHNIIVSAVEGEGLKMVLGSPVAVSEPTRQETAQNEN